MGEQHKTTLDQLRCLCANCHRVLHRKLKAQIVDRIPTNALPDVMPAPLG
jgi:predicted HNH restriction endonuclease